MMGNKAWGMLRSSYKADSKGRYKTSDAMKVATHFANECDRLSLALEASEKRFVTLLMDYERIRNQPIRLVGSNSNALQVDEQSRDHDT